MKVDNKLKVELNSILKDKREKKGDFTNTGSRGYNSGRVDGILYALSEIDKRERGTGKYKRGDK